MNAPLVHPVIPAAVERPEITPAEISIDLDFPDAWVNCRARRGDVRDVLALGARNAGVNAIEDARFDASAARLWQAWEGD